jgi:hypothetical protein
MPEPSARLTYTKNKAVSIITQMRLPRIRTRLKRSDQKFETVPLKDVGYPKKTKLIIPSGTKILVKLANVRGRNFSWFQGTVVKFNHTNWSIQIRFECTDNRPIMKRLQLRDPNHDNQRDAFLAKVVDTQHNQTPINLHELAFLKGYYSATTLENDLCDVSEVKPLRDNNQVKELVFSYPIGVIWKIIR